MPYRRVLLASASPRRAELLRQIGVPFDAISGNADETFPSGGSVSDGVEKLALDKALSVTRNALHLSACEVVLAADTVVVLDNEILGKPRDSLEAVGMLKRLGGRTHDVVTGVALVWLDEKRRIESWHETTRVTFRRLHDAEIVAYVSTARPLDKAGAYGIQEDAAAFVSRVEGCYFNVVGLPLARLSERLFIPT
jgi:septum formation protein